MVRTACFADIPRIAKYIWAFHQNSPYSDISFSSEKVKRQLQALIESPKACLFVHDYGAIAGEIVPLRFGGDHIAQEIFWWAERDGLSLLGRFEAWAEEQSVSYICMVGLVSELNKSEKLCLLYTSPSPRDA